MFELFVKTRGPKGPLKKLSERDIQDQLYGHIRKEAVQETAELKPEPDIPQAQIQPEPKPVKEEPLAKYFETKKEEQPKKAKEAAKELRQPNNTLFDQQPKRPEIQSPAPAPPKAGLPKTAPPKIEVPKIKVPKISIPKISIPRITLPTVRMPRFSSAMALKRLKASLPLLTIIIVVLIALRISTQAVQSRPEKPSPETLKTAAAKNDNLQTAKRVYTIQVAVYGKQQDAESVVSSLAKRGYPASFIKTANSKGYPRFRVYVGSFKTKDEAGGLLKKLAQDENFTDSFIRLR